MFKFVLESRKKKDGDICISVWDTKSTWKTTWVNPSQQMFPTRLKIDNKKKTEIIL